MITTVLNWVVNKISWFFTSVLNIPDMPDIVVEPINFLLNLFETCVSWVSWLYPEPVWSMLCELFILYVSVRATYMIYKFVLKIVGIFL